jgi:hypothetical protein
VEAGLSIAAAQDSGGFRLLFMLVQAAPFAAQSSSQDRYVAGACFVSGFTGLSGGVIEKQLSPPACTAATLSAASARAGAAQERKREHKNSKDEMTRHVVSGF